MRRLADDEMYLLDLFLRHPWKKPVHQRTEKVGGILRRSQPRGRAENDGHPKYQGQPVFAQSARHAGKKQHRPRKRNSKIRRLVQIREAKTGRARSPLRAGPCLYPNSAVQNFIL